MADTKTEYYQDKKGEWRWRKTSKANGQIVGASSEGYADKKDAQKNANRKGDKDTWEFYKDKAGEFRWRAMAANGKQVGRSSEGFKSKRTAEKNAEMNGWPGKG